MSKIKDIINKVKYRWTSISKSQRLNLIAIITLLLVLPASVSSVLIIQSYKSKAASEPPITPPSIIPTATPDIVYSKTYIRNFDGEDQQGRDWGWSGVMGSSAIVDNGKLKLSVPSGHDQVGGNDVLSLIYDQGFIPTLVGDFDVSVDLYPIKSENGYSELKFVSGGSISVRRSKTGTTEYLEVWLSRDNTPPTNTATVRRSLPNIGESLKVKMKRIGNEYLIYYWDQSTFVNILDTEYAYLGNEGMLPTMNVENMAPDYPSAETWFDNYTAYVTIKPLPTAAATPTSTPRITATPTSRPVCKTRPACLDAKPPCLIVEPADGWCPTTPAPKPTGLNLPDLVVLDIISANPYNVSVGSMTKIKFHIFNNGKSVASPAQYSYTNQADGYSQIDQANTCTASTSLKSGESCVSSYLMSFPTAGMKVLTIQLDPNNLVNELNENNNTYSVSVNVTNSSTATPRPTSSPSPAPKCQFYFLGKCWL